jgi:hypothetical protein
VGHATLVEEIGKAHRTLLEICEEVKRGDHLEELGEGYLTG